METPSTFRSLLRSAGTQAWQVEGTWIEDGGEGPDEWARTVGSCQFKCLASSNKCLTSSNKKLLQISSLFEAETGGVGPGS